MKKMLIAFTILAFLLAPIMALAAGVLTGGASDWTKISGKNYKKTVTWVDDGTGTSGVITVPSGLHGSFLFCVLTDPGATAPDDNYDIQLVLHGVDYMGGGAMNRDEANSEVAFPTSATRVLDDNIGFILSGNTINNASGSVTIYIYTD